MLIIYTGNGKGKTSASVGQLIRAHGQGMRTAFAQFMKRSVDAGEQLFLANLLGDNFIAGGEGFFKSGQSSSGSQGVTGTPVAVNLQQSNPQKKDSKTPDQTDQAFKDKKRLLHREAVLKTLHWAEERIPQLDLLVLDEALYALGSDLLSKEEILGIIEKCRAHNTHLVLSGRGLPDWLKEQAELVSELQEMKHPYAQGIKAQRGIEF